MKTDDTLAGKTRDGRVAPLVRRPLRQELAAQDKMANLQWAAPADPRRCMAGGAGRTPDATEKAEYGQRPPPVCGPEMSLAARCPHREADMHCMLSESHEGEHEYEEMEPL